MTYTRSDLEKLIEVIESGDCVLFLGPDLFRDAEQKSLYGKYSDSKCLQMRDDGIEFDETQQYNLNYTVSRYIDGQNERKNASTSMMMLKPDQLTEKKKFSRFIDTQLDVKTIYEQLSSLPFQLVINTNPDNTLYRYYKEKHGQERCRFWYYDFNIENNEVLAEKNLPLQITSDTAIFYNVYGYASPTSISSILLGEMDYLEFVKKVNLPLNGMPICIKNFIKNNKVCLFVGFQHELWSLKILLQAFGFSKQIVNNLTFPINLCPPHIEHFYRNNFNFSFGQPGAGAFINDLYEAFIANSGANSPPARIVHLTFICNQPSVIDADYKEDQRIMNKISKQLKPKQREGKIFISDLATGGEDKVVSRKENYDATDIFIVIGSSLLFDDNEGNFALMMQLVNDNPRKKVIPVFVRYFAEKNVKKLAASDWIPVRESKAVPIINDRYNEDELIADVCNQILSVIDKVSKGV